MIKKRLDIACALIHDPQILILDEPTADLDPVMRKQLWQLIKEINNKGTTIILASHFLAEIELLCHRIAILQNKKILELGTAKELRDLYSKNYEIYIQTATKDYRELIELLKQNELVVNIKKDDDELVIQTTQPQKLLPILAKQLANEQIQTLHITRPTLGNVFEKAVSL